MNDPQQIASYRVSSVISIGGVRTTVLKPPIRSSRLGSFSCVHSQKWKGNDTRSQDFLSFRPRPVVRWSRANILIVIFALISFKKLKNSMRLELRTMYFWLVTNISKYVSPLFLATARRCATLCSWENQDTFEVVWTSSTYFSTFLIMFSGVPR